MYTSKEKTLSEWSPTSSAIEGHLNQISLLFQCMLCCELFYGINVPELGLRIIPMEWSVQPERVRKGARMRKNGRPVY